LIDSEVYFPNMKKTAICRPPFKKVLEPEILAENKNLMD
jgi:hypothetical protein